MPDPASSGVRVALDISCGDEDWGQIILELDEQKAPATTKNFLRYVDEGFYDGTIFHRVIAHFMIQGGGHTPDFASKTKGLHEPVENEAANGLPNKRGTIAMARTSEPHSATSQFFINTVDNGFLNHPGSDGWGYCAFGQVVEGLDVLDRVKSVPTQNDPALGEASRPVDPPQIKRAQRV
ncbi:MAG: peptidylprolyl isomerase [Phycisphaerae bacterium]|jgi:peptidyl-prolyl cis-trans isomerase B (cyclophilin B)